MDRLGKSGTHWWGILAIHPKMIFLKIYLECLVWRSLYSSRGSENYQKYTDRDWKNEKDRK